MLAKYNNLHESIAAKKVEELKAWKKRSEVLRKANTDMQEKLDDLSSKNMELLNFHGQQDNLQKEELGLLREEAKKVDSFLTARKVVRIFFLKI